MKKLILLFVMFSAGAWGEFTCPTGTEAACLEVSDMVCPGSSKCVDAVAVCFDEFPCALSESVVCESEYNRVLNDCKITVEKYNQLASENTNLRERRLEQKNCVLNAPLLEEAKLCVR